MKSVDHMGFEPLDLQQRIVLMRSLGYVRMMRPPTGAAYRSSVKRLNDEAVLDVYRSSAWWALVGEIGIRAHDPRD